MDYTTLAAVKLTLGIGASDTSRDLDIAAWITTASGQIDQMTGTQFGTAGNPAAARIYTAPQSQSLWVDPFTDTTGLTVATGIRGTFPIVIDPSYIVPWPQNAPARGLAYTRIDIPYYFYQQFGTQPTVQVTAVWGYDFVPPQVEAACRLMAARLYKRRESLEGVLAPAEWGAVRVSKQDPDVLALLAPYTIDGMA